MPKKRNQDTITRHSLSNVAVRFESVQPAQPPSVSKLDQTRGANIPVPEPVPKEQQVNQRASMSPGVEDTSTSFQDVMMSESVDYFDDIGFPETKATLVVEDKKIHVNKAVLSQQSPVFNAMFSGSFKERTAREITLKKKKAKDVVEFLRCFYPNMKHAITEHNVLQVLPLAHEYQSPLVADCEKFMTNMCKPGTSLTVSTLLDYILAAEKYDLGTFLCTAVEFCAHVDFDHLNGKTFERKHCYSTGRWIYNEHKTENISSKFLKIDLKTQLAISVKRLQVLEMYKRKVQNKEDTSKERDRVMNLS